MPAWPKDKTASALNREPGRIYENRDFGFTIRFPADWNVVPGGGQAGVPPQKAPAGGAGDVLRARRIRLLVEARQQNRSGRVPPASLSIEAQWIRGMEGAETARGILETIRGEYRRESSGSIQVYDTLGDPKLCSLNGVAHQRMDFSRERGGSYFRTLLLCRVLGDYALIIRAHAWERRALDRLENVLETLEYPRDPLLPALETE
jgi:hypothetical protein